MLEIIWKPSPHMDETEEEAKRRRMIESDHESRIMICCVTFETVKVTDPVKYYGCDKVYVIHYIKDGAEKGNVFRDFYDRVVEILEEENPGIEIEEVHGSMNMFDNMLATVTRIIETEQALWKGNCKIYVNISSGSPEYAAAGAIAAMMAENVTPVSVKSKSYSVGTTEEIKEVYYRDGKPVGLTSETYEPQKLPVYAIPKPEEHLVRGLRVLCEAQRNRRRSKSSDIVPVLKEKGIWYMEDTKRNPKQSDAVRYHRMFVKKWLEKGWVEYKQLQKKYEVSDAGKKVLATFYLTEPVKESEETGK